MVAQNAIDSPVHVSIQNVGGIDETEVELAPNVSILTGRNATNRTSFLRAIMAGLGSDDVSVKADADEGQVTLEIDGTTYRRQLSKRSGTTVLDGEPYTEDNELLDLFAFLLESNDARRAVELGEALYDVIMRPVDTEEIDDEIGRLEAERQELEAELEELDTLKRRLPELEEERTRLNGEIEAKEAAIEEKREELESLAEQRERVTELEETFGALRDLQSELERLRDDREEEQRVVEALEAERDELEATLEGLAEAERKEADDLEGEIEGLRGEIQSIESTVDRLQSVIQFNESMLGAGDSELGARLRAVVAGDSNGSVTDQLVSDGEASVVCWSCGSYVERNDIEATIELLRELHAEKNSRRSELREEIDELEAERKHIERTVEERRDVQRQLADARAELDDRRERIDELGSELEKVETELDEMRDKVDELDEEGEDDYLELQREVTALEVERDRLAARRDDTIDEIETIESRLAGREDLEGRRERINDDIDALRSRIEDLETEAVEQFNDHMDRLIDVLEFDNLERVWIERVETTQTEGRRKVDRSTFELHVVRETDAGSVYEDTVDHLSESEREVVGLVFALSGYLVHDVSETAPFMLLDSLEALDADRISALIDYLADHVPNLIVALLPEDAAAVDEGYARITEI